MNFQPLESFSKEDLEKYKRSFPKPPPPPDEISEFQRERLQNLLREQARRQIEALTLYDPLPFQKAFHECRAPERILRGSNRAGKTLAAAVEISRAGCGRDPFNKYPKTDGRCYIIGPKETHISEVLWPKLARAGAFRIIRDLETKRWRSYRPTDPADLARKADSKPAPPLIPRRMMDGEPAWKSKKMGLPQMVKLITGWEIHFFTAGTEPPKGVAVDLVHFDEDFESLTWYAEMASRLLDKGGLFIWSATPEAGSMQLFELSERANEQKDLPEPLTVEFFAHIDENQFIPEKEKNIWIQKFSIEPEIFRVKVAGEFAQGINRVYPEFTESWHCIKRFEKMPRHWSYYAVIDPGYQVCAITFYAIPPPKESDQIYLYDELYIPKCTAQMFGHKMREKCVGKVFQNFIIDQKGSERTEGHTGKSLRHHYAAALAHYKVSSVESGSGFTASAADRKGGIEAVRELLRWQEDTNHPRLQVVKEACPNFIMEIKRYRYKRVKDSSTGKTIVSDEPEQRGNVHTMDTLRYAAQENLQWVRPTKRERPNPALLAFKAKQDRMRSKKRVAFLGPASDFARGG